MSDDELADEDLKKGKGRQTSRVAAAKIGSASKRKKVDNMLLEK